MFKHSLLEVLKYIFFVVLLGLFIGGFCGCNKNVDDPDNPNQDVDVVEENYTYGPFNHAKLDEEAQEAVLARPIVITIDNLKNARPQSGISKADLMYELPAEGGISRYLAVFYCSSPEVVGPVRSARPYLIDVAKSHGGVYVHCGWSPDAEKYLKNGGWPYINEFAYEKAFWRDKSRKAPHNLYTSIANLTEIIDKKGWNDEKIEPEPFLFLEEGEVQEGEQADVVRIHYLYVRNVYTYDNQTGLYWRQVNENPFVDAVTDEQIQAANIIVQKVKSKVLDNEGRLSINMVGEGEAVLFSQGVVRQGKWQRSSLGQRTTFTDDLTGEEWKLFPGQTWIQVTDNNVTISYEAAPPGSEEDQEADDDK